MTPEEAAALAAQAKAADALVGAAGSPTAGAGEGGPPAPLVAPGDASSPNDRSAQLAELKAENLELLDMGIEMIQPMLPMVRQCYTPEVCAKIAEHGAAVELKYNVRLSAIFGRYKEEIMLAVVTVPPTIKLVVAARVYIAQLRLKAEAEARARERDAAAPPAQGSVTGGAPAPAPA